MAEVIVDVQSGEEQVVRVAGGIDFSNSAKLLDALSCAIDDGRKVVIDLSLAETLDSDAIVGLLQAYRRARAEGVEIGLAAASDGVTRILQMSGLASTFGLVPLKLEKGTWLGDRSELRRQDWQITESVVLAERELTVALRDLAVTAAHEAGLDEASVGDVQLAVTEALANALCHGSPSQKKSRIRLRCLACARAFVAEVSDEGGGVSAEALQLADTSGGEAGLGLRLIQQAMDEVEFLHSERGGQVRMLKWIRP